MSEIYYTVRHSNGKSWAVDKIEKFPKFSIKEKTWYFPEEQQARDFRNDKMMELIEE